VGAVPGYHPRDIVRAVGALLGILLIFLSAVCQLALNGLAHTAQPVSLMVQAIPLLGAVVGFASILIVVTDRR
jgi:hypothetical protein